MAADVDALALQAISGSGDQSAFGDFVLAVDDSIGFLANWFQAISTVAALIKQATSGDPDPTKLLALMTEKINEILGGVQSLAAETKMLFLAETIRHANDRLTTLLCEGKDGPDVDEPLFFSEVQDAVYAFADEAYWIRPYLDTYVFTDYWFPNNGSPPTVSFAGASFVYDPQLSLPAFVSAIRIFSFVVAIFHADPNDRPTVRPYFTDLATLLDRHYEKATAGLLTVPIPKSGELLVQREESDYYGFEKYFDHDNFNLYWRSGEWPGEIGAVDMYSVFAKSAGSPGFASGVYPNLSFAPAVVPATNAGNIIDVYPNLKSLLGMMWMEPFPRDHLYRWFHIRVRIGNLARLKALYLAKGYHHIWSLVQKLRFLSSGEAGTPEFNFPATPPPSATDRNAHWCLSELDPIISEPTVSWGNDFLYEKFVIAARAGDVPQPITAEDIISRLQAVVEYSTNYPLESPGVPVRTPKRPLSLRATIAAVAV